MTHWGVGARLLSCASVLALSGAFAGSAAAHSNGPDCTSITNPTTINRDKRCVRVTKTVNGNVVNNATVGKTHNDHHHSNRHDDNDKRPGFFIGSGGLLKGKLINNGAIFGGDKGTGALTLGRNADVRGGIYNNGAIASKDGSGISLGYYDHDKYPRAQAAHLTGDIVNGGLIHGDDYGVAARYGTMSGMLINKPHGAIIGDDIGVFISDSFTSWSGGIENSGLIYGDEAGIQIGGLERHGGEGGEHGGGYNAFSVAESDDVVFSGGIFNYDGGEIISKSGPSIAIGGASFSGGVYNNGLITQYLGYGGEHDGGNAYFYGGEHGTPSPYKGVGIVFTAPTVEGGLTNDVNGEIYGRKGPAVWITDKTQSFAGGIANLGTIAGANDGIRIESATFAGGLSNGASGAIIAHHGDAVFATSAWSGNVANYGLISGAHNGFTYAGSTFDGNFGNAGLIEGGNAGVSMSGTVFDGAFTNTAGISGGATGVALSFDNVTGAFTNSGWINGGSGDGVSINVGTWGAADARADIVNADGGAITGGETGFLLDVGTIYGDFINDGVISGNGENTGAHIIADQFFGNIQNNDEITSPYDALVVDINTFEGSFGNAGDIAGGVNGAVFLLGEMTGGFTNSGSISGESANGVDITVDNWGAVDARADIANAATGAITGGETGFALNASTLHGSFTNDGIIGGGATGASFEAHTFDAPFANSGGITGGVNGVVMALGDASGGFTNSGSIGGETGGGVDIVVANWGSALARADIVNTSDGLITGGATGFSIDLVTMHGDVTNDGLIEGGNLAVLMTGETFDGAFSNTGGIDGGGTGVSFALDTVTGAFTNSGSIAGGTGDGVAIDVDTWGAANARADIVNTASGVISGGDTGFLLDVGTMHGDFINDGAISGQGADTGVHIIAGQFVGNVINNDQISSPYDALVADIDTLDGSFSNTGTIAGGDNGAVLILGQMTGDFTNSASISGESANGVDISVGTWGSADARVAIVNTVDGVISGGVTGFALDAETLHGAFTNDGTIDGGTTGASFAAYTFDAPFANSGAITGGANGVVMVFGDAAGDFSNSGSIGGETGNGVDIVVTNWGATSARADIVNTADGVVSGGQTGFALELVTMHGDVTNDGLIEGGSVAVAMSGGTFDGAFENTSDIEGGATGVAMTLNTVTGAFTNSGSISGDSGDGVAVHVGTWGSTSARADVINTASGVITGGDTGFLLDVGTMHGDFINDGVINGDGLDTGAHIIAGTFVGDVVNNHQITSPFDALVADIDTFNGSFANTADIAGGDNGAVLILGQMTGDFTNSGSIGGETGNGADITVDAWGSSEAPVDILNTVDGVITGGETGFALDADALHGTFTNDGRIQGGATGASFAAATFDAPFANSGDIAGGANGVVMALGTATGGFNNSGSINGETGTGVDILVTSWGTAGVPAHLVNTADGVISGGEAGLSIELVTLHGDVTNDGLVQGGVALAMSGGTFDGAFTNTGDIEGTATGVAFALSSVTGPFDNSGSISGGTGVAIDVDTWGAAAARADIVNAASGVISGGETGFLLDVGTMHGDFVNNGAISGGGPNTGVHIIAGTFVGDIVNNNAIDAPSNVLDLDIGTLNGGVINTGTIAATGVGGVAVALNIGNGATFTNTGGGLIIGDSVFGGEAAYHFIGEDGGVQGNLIGQGGDDTITVQNGTQSFTGGTASNFASFTVANGGAAIMGALSEGDTGGTGYAFSNVANLNVNNGGLLYIDKSTTLVVSNNFTQQAGGTVEFFLGAPGGEGFADLTGNVVAGAGDYGQIVVNGTVNLDGAVVGLLDPAFASANPNLNQVLYDDVIIATGGISGDFQTVALIADSSIFELNEIIDGNAVDMIVARTSLTNLGSLPGIVVNTGGPFDAMVSDRSNGIGSGSCGLAGDGWCFNRFAANDQPGATQVMTDATPGVDPFAWLRTGVRKVGETAAWGRAINVRGETDGDAATSGSDFDVVGVIGGIDHVFSPIFMAGIAAQWTTTDIDFAGRPDNAEVESFEAGLYASYGDTRLYLNANASVIWHSIDVFRFTPGGEAIGDYNGTTISAFAEAGKTFETEDGMRIQPFIALSYSHLDTDAYSETGTGTLLNISESEFDSFKSMVGARVGYPITMKSGRKIVPEARLAWVHEFGDDQASFLATIQGQPPAPSLIRGEKYSRDTIVAGAGITVPLSDSSSVFVDYDAGLNADVTTHTVSLGVRLTW